MELEKQAFQNLAEAQNQSENAQTNEERQAAQQNLVEATEKFQQACQDVCTLKQARLSVQQAVDYAQQQLHKEGGDK